MRQSLRTCVRGQYYSKDVTNFDFPIAKKEAPYFCKVSVNDNSKGPGFAYHSTFQYPDTYEPWNFNYKGQGMFIGLLITLFYGKINM